MTTDQVLIYSQIAQVIRDFSRSERFSLLRNVQVGRFLSSHEGANTSLHEMTFADLLDRVSVLGGSCGWCTLAEAQGLLHVLRAISEDNGNTCEQVTLFSGETSEAQVVGRESPSLTSEECSGISSIQLESDLKDLVRAVVSHPRYLDVMERTLGEFWDETWTPAPFEESLTLKQLASLDIAVFFKKKMVSETRLENLCQALRKTLNLLSLDSAHCFVNQRGSQQSNVSSTVRTLTYSDSSIIPLCIHELLERGYRECPYPELASLHQMFYEQCTAQECVEVITLRELPPALVRKIAGIVSATISEDPLRLVRTLLQGPAVPIDCVAQVLAASVSTPTALSRALATLVVRGLGATQVAYQGRIFEGFWTLHPTLIATMLGSRPQGKRSLSLDPFLQEQLQSHGGTAVSRKGRRKRLKTGRRGGK